MKLPPQDSRSGPKLVLVGIDHRHAPLELRERVALGADEVGNALGRLRAHRSLEEAFVLSTCNRTEVYALPRDEENAYRAVVDEIFDARAPGIERQGRLYVKWHEEAASHLLHVACGLESMVLGEPEILGQVKQAAEAALGSRATGPVLRQLLKSAQLSGRRARAETELATGAVSFGYAAVELARNIFSSLETTRVLLVGAGDIAHQVARNLRERGARELTVTNRGAERAESLREEFPEAHIVPFEERGRYLARADLVVVSTAAEEPVVHPEHLGDAASRRQNRPLLVVDLSVPRNVAPEVRRIGNVFLHDVDSLQHLIQRNLKRRREAVPQVREIVEQELEHYHGWYRNRRAEPVVVGLQKQAEAIRRQEVDAALDAFPEDTHPHLERLTRNLVRKLLHHPSSDLRKMDHEADRLQWLRELFHLEESSAEDGHSGDEEP